MANFYGSAIGFGGGGGLGAPYTVKFLLLAGGGGAGRDGTAGICHGGTAGGLRTSYGSTSGGGASAESDITLYTGGVYTLTVGAGATGSSGSTTHPDGNDSSIAGPVLVTLTSVGAGATVGGGADISLLGRNGGCGGNSQAGGGEGTAGQGFDGLSWVSGYARAGGSSVASVGASNTAGTNGLQVDIDGNNYYWGAGGGGGGHGTQGGAAGPGGSGGGGGGGQYPGFGPGSGGTGGINNGTGGSYAAVGGGHAGANTGSGCGGGGASSSYSANGGSGIIILRMATANYSSATTGSPTVATIGSDTVLTYLGDGTYTA